MVDSDPAVAAVKTYNYLRIALAALVLLLYSSVVLEWWAAGRCLQTSISAYYYTPVHAVFIGVLVTMGVCLVALKGNTDGEDVLMNLAGMLAPGVAFIPTVGARECSSAPLLTPDIPAAVANNMPALFVTGATVGAVALWIARREGRGTGLSTADRLGLALSLGVLGAGVVWFFVDRDSFIAHGHDAAAIPMFLAIIGVVWLNARDVQQAVTQEALPTTRSRYVAMYRAVAIAMLVALAATVVINLATASTTVVFWVEVVLITLFAVFWAIQTRELWNRGLRRT
ncbi:MAG TPA: hypothetical protein VES93_07595 [Ornithinibacter sp.]|nr:hypothetical protein [Ornithinibacter sp.]